jgi:hypothetical protein
VSTYDWLLFLHLLAAFAVVATVVMFSAFAFGWTRDRRVLTVANVVWAIGGLGTLVFGVWLALNVSGYDITDGWIITALVLWAVATELGRRAQLGYTEVTSTANPTSAAADAEAAVASSGSAQIWHWLRSLAVLALLVVMIYKPGA